MATKADADAFRHQSESQKQFADYGSLLEFNTFLCAICRLFSTADLPNNG